jgi:bifunctional non-homologous end joining protein LigD
VVAEKAPRNALFSRGLSASAMLTVARQMTRAGKARVGVGSRGSVETVVNRFRTHRANRARRKPFDYAHLGAAWWIICIWICWPMWLPRSRQSPLVPKGRRPAVVADSMPDRISPQLATLVSAPPTGKGWAYEIKFDGYRILARCESGEARLFTRNGNDWTTKMETLARQVSLLPAKTAWLDGEVVVLGDDGLPKFNALQNAFDSAGTEHIVYFVFDLLYLNGKDLRTLDLSSRRAALEDLFADYDQGRVRLSQAFGADGASVLQSACKMGLEGIIAKRLNARYESRRSEAWLKVKCQLRHEFVIGGFTVRGGGSKEIGSLLLGVYDDDRRLRYAGSVGTGWDSATATSMLRALEKLEVSKSAFDPNYAPTKGRWSKRAKGSERWVKPTAVAEISFVEWTPDGSVRHPTFRGMREDKPAKDIRRESAAKSR